MTACLDGRGSLLHICCCPVDILSQKHLLGQSKILTRTVIRKSKVPIKAVNGPTITVTYHELFRRNGTYVNFIRQNGIRLNGITQNGKTPQNLVEMNPPPLPLPPTLSVYTLVYPFQEILILSEGVPVYGHLVEHIACIQQGHARRDTIASVLSLAPCQLITTDLYAST